MLASRKIDDLVLPAKIRALKFLGEARHELNPEGIDVLVTSTVRDGEAQNALYAQGRTRAELDAVGLTHVQPAPGRIVTNAHAGQSFHQYHVAFDVLLVRHGKAIDDNTPDGDALWERVGQIGERCGLAWAGRWTGHLREKCHFQFTNGLTLAQLRDGITVGESVGDPEETSA